MKVISPSEDLHVVPIWDKSLSDIVNLLWLLTLPPPLGEYDISLDIEVCFVSDVALDSDETRLLRMLQVKAMAFGDLAVDRLLHPSHFVNKTVAPLVEHVQSKSVLVVDHPDKQETILLDLVQRDV